MRFPTLGDKANFISANVRNDESSATIQPGQPVILAVDGTEDGLAVVLPTSATAARIGAFNFGVATMMIAPATIGEVQLNGMYGRAAIVLQTRAASTDTWASYAAGAIGNVLHPVSVANGLSNVAASTASAGAGYFLAETYASFTTQASSVGSGLSLSRASKVFVRVM